MNRAALAARLAAGVSVATVAASAAGVLYAYQHATPPRATAARPTTRPPAHAQSAPLAASRRYLGVFERGAPYTYAPIDHFAATVAGVQPDIVDYFSGWGDPFQARFATAAAAHAAVVLVQMEPFGHSMASIAAGASDAYLRSYARSVRAFRRQIILSFAPEANASWYPWGRGHTRPSVWVAAWRHVVTVFRREGATNVTWLWDISSGNRHYMRDYWPGRHYLTWVGLDGYFYNPGETYQSIFGRTLTQLRKITSAPVLISEVAAGPLAGQAAKIPDLFAGINRDHLLGLIWFDVAQHHGRYHQNWRLEDHPSAISAFRAGAQSLMQVND